MRNFIPTKWKLVISAIAYGMLAFAGLLTSTPAAAACAAADTSRGVATKTITVASTGAYRVWSRMEAGDAADTLDSYTLRIYAGTSASPGTCVLDSTTVGGTGITDTAWKWVDYQNATTTTKINATFSSTGQYTVEMVGKDDNVRLDRVILTTDMACDPSTGNGLGDNCATNETTAPTVSLTAPAAGATLSGSVPLTATASDASGVSSVTFYDGTTQIGSPDTTSPYSINWDSTAASNGAHTLKATATDGVGNTASSTVNVTVNNPSYDFAVTDITMSPAAPKPGDAVTFTAAIKNVGGVVNPLAGSDGQSKIGLAFLMDGATVDTFWSIQPNLQIQPNQTVSFTANGGDNNVITWPATAGSHTVQAFVDNVDRFPDELVEGTATSTNNKFSRTFTVTTSDTTAPTVSLTAPAASATVSGAAVTVSANASDNVGVSKVEFFDNGTLIGAADTASPYSVTWNTTSGVANGSHSLTARATDTAGNTTTTAAVTVTVSNSTTKTGDVNADGSINISDLSVLAFNYGGNGKTRAQGDLNADGLVNVFDLSILASNWGK